MTGFLKLVVFVLGVSLLEIVEGWLSPSITLSTRPTRRTSLLPFQQEKSLSHSDAQLPIPKVWILDDSVSDVIISWKSHSINDYAAAHATYKWARNFVLKLDLCPFAKASLSEENAMDIYLVDPTNLSEDTALRILENVAAQFTQFITLRPALESAAISFVVFDSNNNNSDSKNDGNSFWGDSFSDFYDWFVELEDDIWGEEYDTVTLAPFHPDWQFGGDDDSETKCLEFEKRSPFPVITLVSTDVIDKAGPEASSQISDHNAEVLTNMELNELQSLWKTSVGQDDRSDNEKVY
jgi:hypothetical protein